jgi:hypothetical protein
MSAMQAPLSGRRGLLPALPAYGVESGKLGEFGLSPGDYPAADFYDFVLAVFLSRLFNALGKIGRLNKAARFHIPGARSLRPILLLLPFSKHKIRLFGIAVAILLVIIIDG